MAQLAQKCGRCEVQCREMQQRQYQPSSKVDGVVARAVCKYSYPRNTTLCDRKSLDDSSAKMIQIRESPECVINAGSRPTRPRSLDAALLRLTFGWPP
jgi:hypothetical protein